MFNKDQNESFIAVCYVIKIEVLKYIFIYTWYMCLVECKHSKSLYNHVRFNGLETNLYCSSN